jgi:hypothetical protein
VQRHGSDPARLDASTTGSGDGDVVANVIAHALVAGSALATYLVVRSAGRRDPSLSATERIGGRCLG